MNNYYFPKMNEVPQNLFPNPLIQNDNVIQNQLNQFSLPLNLNQVVTNNQNIQNIQNQLLPLLYPDQFLCQNPLFFLPRLLLVPQTNQINYLNQLITEQNLRNPNDLLVNNNINNIYNNLINTQQLNILNQNILANLINNKNTINEQNKQKDNKETINNHPEKKFFTTQINPNPQNSSIQNNDKNIINEKITTENNKIYPNILKNNIINNNHEKINEKPEENKDNTKAKFSLFTISNINTNSNNEVNNNIQTQDKLKITPPLIKFQLQNSDLNQIKPENIIYNDPNKLSNNESNKYLFNLQHLDDKQDKDKIKYYRCSFKECNKVFLKQSNLKDHIRTHTGEKPYICLHPGCGKTFSQHGNLKKHEKIHSGNKKYYCTYPNCGKKFSASYNLKIHYRCHTGEKPYKCNFPNCGRDFYDKGNLKYHEKNMHALENMENPYSCEHMGCNAKFKTKLEKLKHHSEMEVDCYKERKELIKLIQRYKIFLKKIIKKKAIDENKNEIVLKLKKNYEEIQNKLIDQDLFKYYLGDNFENDCTNVEEINTENDEKNNLNPNEENKENKDLIIKEEKEEKEEKEKKDEEEQEYNDSDDNNKGSIEEIEEEGNEEEDRNEDIE